MDNAGSNLLVACSILQLPTQLALGLKYRRNCELFSIYPQTTLSKISQSMWIKLGVAKLG